MTTPTFSPYGGFSEGDHVTRDGTDVHLVKNMTADGFAATFVCVVAPTTGWTEVGEEENNVCRRYARLKRNEATQEWEQDPDAAPSIHPPEDHATKTIRQLFELAVRDVVRTHITRMIKAMFPAIARRHRSAHYQRKLHRRPKRRALRK